jgi:hypothetical protein
MSAIYSSRADELFSFCVFSKYIRNLYQSPLMQILRLTPSVMPTEVGIHAFYERKRNTPDGPAPG